MKRRILTTTGRLLVALVALVMASVTSATAGEIRHTLTLDPAAITIDTVTAPDGTPYVMVNAPDANYFAEPGEPMIPMKRLNFLVPTYTNNFTVSIDDKLTETSTSLLHPIFPMQEPRNLNEYAPDMFTEGIQQVYEDSSLIFNPSVKSDYFLNGCYHIVSVGVPMVGYVPDLSKLETYSQVCVTLEYDDCVSDELGSNPMLGLSDVLETDISDFVVNSPVKNEMRLSNSTPYPIAVDPVYYYIIVPEDLVEEVASIANWKRQKGYNVTVKTVESILSTAEYSIGSSKEVFDKESSIRNWLISQVNTLIDNNIKADSFRLLIVGDSKTSAPIRKFRVRKPHSEHPDYEIVWRT